MNSAAELTDPSAMPRPSLLRAWWTAVVWILIIACESTDTFSSRNTGSILYSLLVKIFGSINFYKFLVFHHYLRKTGHVVGYGMLTLLLLRGWKATFAPYNVWSWRTALLSWLGTLVVASLDEWHQTFIPSRTGTIWDVALDWTAGFFFLMAAYVWFVRKKSLK